MNISDRSKKAVELRLTGLSFQAIAKELGVWTGTARQAIIRAMKRGEITREQARLTARYGVAKSRISDDEYNQRWLARLASKSVPGPNGCTLLPDVFHNEDGYAQLGHRDLGVFAHRVATILKGRSISPGFMACHRCGNHGCVNDDHIYVGTMKQNARDTVDMGRHLEANKTECIHGHPFTPENTRVTKTGKRQCVMCQRIATRKKAGWPQELWEIPPQKPGTRPDAFPS